MPHLIAIVLLVCSSLSTFANGLKDDPIEIRSSWMSSKALCNDASRILSNIPRYRFWNGQWREAFGSVEWDKDFYPSIDSEGKQRENKYEFRSIDINNDGQSDVVIKETGMLRSALWDWLYVMAPDEFRSLRANRTIGKSLGIIQQLNPGNAVIFTNKQEAVPTEMQIWRHGSKNYIVMRELQFSTEEHKDPASAYVAELRGPLGAPINRRGNRTLIPRMVCKFKQK